ASKASSNSVGAFNFPIGRFTDIAHAVTALTHIIFSPSVIAATALGESDRSSLHHQSKAWGSHKKCTLSLPGKPGKDPRGVHQNPWKFLFSPSNAPFPGPFINPVRNKFSHGFSCPRNNHFFSGCR